ncbi:YpzI family protein [Bacillus sp. DJP31]
MGKDRQEKKVKASGKVESDRDQQLNYPGATTMEGPKEARERSEKNSSYT